ncbi:hypothetical protein C2G38_262275 [Gigaspora rosea]|uniref:Uncharacterized protein n=1 Tax=Gigaspora rosea TaxID=44941 RepID=A0A397ULB7_9GLOM|nr:hypothetical protein C2G38_262275 [Gigaspora rosea]
MDEIAESGHGYEGGLPISHDDKHDKHNKHDKIFVLAGMFYNMNNIIGSGIFVIPGDVWRLTRSPGAALMLWLVGGVFNYLCSLAFPELGITVRPTAIIADAYVASLYLIYAIRGENEENRPSEYLSPSGYFSKDSLIISFIAIAILLFITAYHMYSRRLAVRINIAFGVVKFLALFCIIIVGMLQLQKAYYKNHWKSIFNNTISDRRTLIKSIGSYGNAMLEVLFTYEGWNSVNCK